MSDPWFEPCGFDQEECDRDKYVHDPDAQCSIGCHLSSNPAVVDACPRHKGWFTKKVEAGEIKMYWPDGKGGNREW